VPSVLQPWVEELTGMQQSVLLSSIRAPDGLHKGHPAKYLWRWLRRCVLYCSFGHVILTSPTQPGGGNFTGPVRDADEAMRDYFYHVDEVPHHAHLHLMHAAEILGYKHPDERTRSWWHKVYTEAANDMHLDIENEGQMDYRLGDQEDQWRTTERFPAIDPIPRINEDEFETSRIDRSNYGS
jgi:hypothetical protein